MKKKGKTVKFTSKSVFVGTELEGTESDFGDLSPKHSPETRKGKARKKKALSPFPTTGPVLRGNIPPLSARPGKGKKKKSEFFRKADYLGKKKKMVLNNSRLKVLQVTCRQSFLRFGD